MSEKTVSVSREKNHHLTRKCGHGPSDICDYCLVAYDEHVRAERARRRVPTSHTLGGKRFRCRACATPRKRVQS